MNKRRVIGLGLALVLIVSFFGWNHRTRNGGGEAGGDSKDPARGRLSPETTNSGSGREPRESGRPTDKASLLQRLQAGKDDPASLLALVREVAEMGLTQDIEVRNVYVSAFDSFTPDQLGELFKLWPKDTSHAALLGKLTEQLTEAELPRLAAVMKARPGGAAWSGSEAVIAKRSALFSPDRIAGTLGALEGADLKKIGEGLGIRVNLADPTQQMKMLTDYFAVLTQPALTGPLAQRVAALMSKSDPKGAVKWMLEQPAELVKEGDSGLMQQLGKKDVTSGVDFVNQLIERGENGRADAAIQSLSEHYSRQSPGEALAWGLSLSPDISSRRQVIAYGYSALLRQDPAAAQQVRDATVDPKTLEIFKAMEGAAEHAKKAAGGR